jgi:phage tail sheath protein FI
MKDPNLPTRLSLVSRQTRKPQNYIGSLQAALAQIIQSVAFEPNGETRWKSVRSTLTDYLLGEWRKGALLGSKPEEAFFVRCDRTTMTQTDLDEGRLICLVGVAPVKPAEFVIFQIHHRTAMRK